MIGRDSRIEEDGAAGGIVIGSWMAQLTLEVEVNPTPHHPHLLARMRASAHKLRLRLRPSPYSSRAIAVHVLQEVIYECRDDSSL